MNLIKILLVEDAPADAELITWQLNRGKINCEVIIADNKAKFVAALHDFLPDIILCDHSLPLFDSHEALRQMKIAGCTVPFILITAVMTDENAVSMMKEGVNDYILKDRLSRLPAAVTVLVEKHRLETLHKATHALLVKTEKQYRHTLDSMIEGVQIHDFDWRYIYVNDALVKYSQYAREQLVGYTMMEKYPGIEQTELFATMRDCMIARKSAYIETDFIFPDGSKTFFELSIQPIPEGLFILSVDRNEQKKSKEKLIKVNRLYSFISQINQNIVHVKDEETLFDNACRIALELGKFKMAWIGLLDENKTRISIAAHHGIPPEDLSLFDDVPYERDGPLDMVLRTGTYYVCNDIANNLNLENWKPYAAKQNIHSCMVLPIKKASGVVGTFNLYATELNFFDNEEMELLAEVTGDISFAIDVFDDAKKHRATEQLLIQNENRFRTLIEKSSDLITLSTVEGKMIYGSPSVTHVLGYTMEEFLKKSFHQFIHPEDIDSSRISRINIIQIPGKSCYLQQRLLHKKGEWIWFEGTLTNMLHEPGIHAIVSNFRDISERKIAAQSEEFNRNNLNALINNTNDLMWSLDKNFKLITFNQPFLEMVKLMSGLDVVSGSNVLALGFPGDQLIRHNKFYERAFAGEIFTEIEPGSGMAETWSEISYYPIRKDNEVIGTACHSRDITERITAQKKLSKSEEQYRQIVETSQEGIWLIDANNKTFFVNKRFTEIFGYSFDEMMGKTNFDLMDEEGKIRAAEKIERRKEGISEDFELVYIAKNGNRIWTHVSASPISDDNGNYLGGLAMINDITERKKSEENLLLNEAHLAEAQRMAKMGSWNFDINADKLTWSDELYHVFGVDKQTFTQTFNSFIDLVDATDREFVRNASLHTQKTGDPFTIEYHITTPNGEKRVIEEHCYGQKESNGMVTHLLGTVQDITLIKKAAQAVKQSNERYELATKATNDVIWDWDIKTDQIYRSENYQEQFGYQASSENMNNDSWAANIYGEDKERTMISLMEKVSDGHSLIWECEYRFLKQNGELVYIKDKGHIVRNETGKAVRMVGAMSDISNQKLSEGELLAEQKRLKKAQAIAHLGDWEMSFTNNEALFSEEACRIYGLSTKENKQTYENWVSFIHPEDLDYVMALNAEAQKNLSDSLLNHRIILKDGTVKHIHAESKFKFDQTGRPTGLYGITLDVTERDRTEAERIKITNDLIQRNKDLEQFAYIISHNLRAPVANILGASKGLNHAGLNAAEKESLNKGLHDSVSKLDSVVKDLNRILQIKREVSETRERVIFSNLVEDIKISIKNLIDKHRIEIKYDFSQIDEMFTVKSYLYSIFYNLISNSIKYRQPAIPCIVEIKSCRSKNELDLFFSDNGLGIDLEKRGGQVFGLYKRFHTHIGGKGMGLYMVKTQVESLGGKIGLKSIVNKGTEFEIKFEL